MNELEKLDRKGLLRQLRTIESEGNVLIYNNQEYLNLSSNDYLGISARSDFQTEFLETLPSGKFLMGALSSRLLTGNSKAKDELETFLAEIYQQPACLLFNSGYHANTGILPAITEKSDLIIADKLVHASIIDGLRLCNCKWSRFNHNNYEDLERQLKNAYKQYNQIIIVTESIFSMDGDCADLDQLVF